MNNEHPPYCKFCNTKSEWIVQTANLAYFYCKACKKEVVDQEDPEVNVDHFNWIGDSKNWPGGF